MTDLNAGSTLTYGLLTPLAGSQTDSADGAGSYTVDVLLAAAANYTLDASDNANVSLNIAAGTLNGLTLNIGTGSSITVDSLINVGSSPTVNFSGGGGSTVTFAPGLLSVSTSPVVNGFTTGDNISFGSTYDTGGTNMVSYDPSTGVLTLLRDGAAEGTVTLNGTYTLGDFHVVDVDGQAEIVGCFLRGTRVLTSEGEVLVEKLRAGDLIRTLSGELKPIKSVKLRSFASQAQLASKHIRPVRIAPGAFEDNVPSRELCVSPDHAMYLDGVLVPAVLLVNGETVTQPQHRGTADYFHIEVEPHDVILAEGAAAETYLDNGNMIHIGRPGVISLLPAAEPKNWEDACAPLVLAGPLLIRIQARLLSRAMELQEEQLANVA